jgi:hypothetical protein
MRLVSIVAGWLLCGPVLAAEATALEWPREYSNEAGAKLVLYQPQLMSWEKSERLHARAAVAFSNSQEEAPSFGALELEADTEVNLEERLVRITGLEIVEHNFPSLDEARSARLLAKLDELLPKQELIVDLDRVLASLERNESLGKGVDTRTDAPEIFVSDQPAILVLLDGKPIWSQIEDSDLEFAVNTNWDLFHHEKSSGYYLLNGDAWIKASRLGGPWSPAGKLPKSFKKLPKKDENWQEVRANLPGKKITAADVPDVYMSEAPAELIVVFGPPSLEPVEGTELLWVTNTESDLFLHGKESRFYYLVSGRWFRADGLDGEWSFATHDLPDDFSLIPEEHPAADVLASVPGTSEAQEAVLLSQIPQKAQVQRDQVSAEVSYVGDPEFKPIDGTSMYYAVNTQNDVIRVGDLYYLCFQAVWFVSASATGPWEAADSIPDEISTIPPSSPVYNTTYVQVYESDEESVTYGYTSGYWGVFLAYGVMVYGSGWYYPPYYYYGPYHPYPVYWGYPYSYGVGAYYNPYTGTYGRGARVYGPYGGMGRGVAYNPRTGTYARGASAWGPYQARGWAEAYNPRTGTYAQTRQGANSYSNWGTTGIRRGDDWARTAHYTDSRGTIAGGRTSEGGAALVGRGESGSGGLARSGSGDVFAGKDGNIYRKNEDGWQKYHEGGWNPVEAGREDLRAQAGSREGSRVGSGQRPSTTARPGGASQIDRSTLDQLDRDRAGRARGSQRANQYGGWKGSGGGYRPTRGGYRGGGGRRRR